jgi:hypothetical protein
MNRLVLFAIVVLMLGVVGCKGQPGYVGTFGIELTAEQKKQMDDAKAEVAKLTGDQKKQGEGMLKMMESVTKMELTIEADGKWKATGTPDGKDVTGTYKAEGNVLTMTPTEASAGDNTPKKLTYSEEDKTLKSSEGQPITFKKK